MDAEPTNPLPEATCPGCAARDRKVADLEARVATLEQALQQAARAGKRQAAPFSKGPPKPDPKPPGRKPRDRDRPQPPPKGPRPQAGRRLRPHPRVRGRAAPPRVDEVHDAPLPARCPCGGA